MRVIAGKFKGRRLKSVPGSNTRPTSDKIKEAVFHMMGPYFQGGHCLDLFAGSGSLGIEAYSRGMTSVTFIDRSSQAIKCIRRNLTELNLLNDVEVYRNDAFRAMNILRKKGETFDLIIIDPPYDDINVNDVLLKITDYKLLSPHGMIYVEHRVNTTIKISNNTTVFKEKEFNETTKITLLKDVECE